MGLSLNHFILVILNSQPFKSHAILTKYNEDLPILLLVMKRMPAMYESIIPKESLFSLKDTAPFLYLVQPMLDWYLHLEWVTEWGPLKIEVFCPFRLFCMPQRWSLLKSFPNIIVLKVH